MFQGLEGLASHWLDDQRSDQSGAGFGQMAHQVLSEWEDGSQSAELGGKSNILSIHFFRGKLPILFTLICIDLLCNGHVTNHWS